LTGDVKDSRCGRSSRTSDVYSSITTAAKAAIARAAEPTNCAALAAPLELEVVLGPLLVADGIDAPVLPADAPLAVVVVVAEELLALLDELVEERVMELNVELRLMTVLFPAPEAGAGVGDVELVLVMEVVPENERLEVPVPPTSENSPL